MADRGHDDEETASEREARHRDLSRERAAPARNKRSDELEDLRSDRAAALEDSREQRASDLRVQDALRRERVDVRIVDHENRLIAIDSAVARSAEKMQHVDDRVDSLHAKFDKLVVEQDKRDAVATALRDEITKANEKQITTRTFMLGVSAIMITILIAVVSQAHLFG